MHQCRIGQRRAWHVAAKVVSFVFAVSFLASAGTVSAQDWTGWYAGLSLGGYSADANETERDAATGVPTDTFDYTGSGAVAGLFLGRNWQKEDLLYGFELGLRGNEEVALTLGPDDVFYYRSRATIDVKGKVGYLLTPETQVFASAGVSFGSQQWDWTSAGVFESGRVSTNGYALGLGVERLVGKNGVARLSVDYHNRDSDRFEVGILPGFTYENSYDSLSLSVGYSVFLDR